MKAIELSGLEGFEGLRVVDVEKPEPGGNQVLIEVKAAGINFAELELTRGTPPSNRFPTFSVSRPQGSLPKSARR
jgi:NADPH2:quinone reductase